MENNIIGFDTIRIYSAGNYYTHLLEVLGLEFKKRPVIGYSYPLNGSYIIFTFPRGLSTTISFSIPRIYYQGDNTKLAGIEETRYVLYLVEELCHLNLEDFKITRLHITSNFKVAFSPKRIKQALGTLSHFKGSTSFKNGEYIHLNRSFKKSRKVLLVYNKGEQKRLEYKFEAKSNSGEGIGRTIQRALKHDNNVKALLSQSFYEAAVSFYVTTIGKALQRKNQSIKDKTVTTILLSALSDNYNQSIT